MGWNYELNTASVLKGLRVELEIRTLIHFITDEKIVVQRSCALLKVMQLNNTRGETRS